MKHTPGPWNACNKGHCVCGQIWGGDHPVASVTCGKWGDEYPTLKVTGPSLARKCEAVIELIEYGDVHMEEAHANAQLIAAAPEMYEALKAALPYVEGAYECAFPNEAENLEVLGNALGAIAKAEGRAA